MRQLGLEPDGLMASMKAGATWFDLTTNAPTVVREVHARLAEKGIDLLDAPVSGGPAGARSGKLAIYVGGDRAAFDRHKPLLDVLGDQVLHVGSIGAGNATKLVHNVASLIQRMAIAEVMTLGVKAGVEPRALWSAIRQGAIGRSRSFDRIDRYMQSDYEPPTFSLRLAHKDLMLGLELGEQLGVPMRHAEVVRKDFDEALARGWGERDARTPMRLQNERAGVEIRLSAAEVKEVLSE
jgi:3-hydroxyisobutyrate dehydrogenase